MLKGIVDAVFLDVDGTLTDSISWLELTRGLGASVEEHSRIFEDFKRGLISYEKAKKQLIDLWQATGNANKKFLLDLFESWKFRDNAREITEYLEQDGYQLCIISGSVDLWVETVAKKLKIPDWYANTSFIWDSKDNLVDFKYYADQAQKKLEQFKDYLKKRRLIKGKCAVVGNGENDLALFKEMKYGVVINDNPIPELKSLSYKVISNLKDLKAIF